MPSKIKERALQVIHKGCRLTADEMRSKVQEVETAKKQKIQEKKEKVEKKNLKLSHQKLAETTPESTVWDPEHLTKAQLLVVLDKRKISCTKSSNKSVLIELIVNSNKQKTSLQ